MLCNNRAFLLWYLVIIGTFLFFAWASQERRSQSKQRKVYNKVPGKIVWLLWLPGWDSAPWLVRQVRASWERQNPDWKVICLDEKTVSNYIQIPPYSNIGMSMKSNIICVNLLARYGGVWADTTMLCLVPLDFWVFDVLEPVGFWMFNGLHGSASGFVISLRGHFLARAWATATNKQRHLPSGSTSDSWLDNVFMHLVSKKETFAAAWAQVPRLSSKACDQANLLVGCCSRNDPELKELLRTHCPYILKLTHHEDIEPTTHATSNALFAIELALEPTKASTMESLAWCSWRPPSKDPTLPKSDRVMVAADCGLRDEVLALLKLCTLFKYHLMVYDKCQLCAFTPSGVWCRPLANVGRDMHVYLHFVVTCYNQLPETVVFTSTNLTKHNRYERLLHLLQSNDDVCNTSSLEGLDNFAINSYEGTPLEPAHVRPFRAWFEHNIARWDPTTTGPCWNGLMRTGRRRLLRHSRDFYARLYMELATANSPEAGHYLERAMMHVF